MGSIEEVTRELLERLRAAQCNGPSDDWLRRLASHPPRTLATRRHRPAVARALRIAAQTFRQR